MKMPQPLRINSQEELDVLLKKKQKDSDSSLECFILLNFGIRSSKTISLNEHGDYWIYNECDDSEEIIRHHDFEKSFLGKALGNGALYRY